MRLFHVIAVFSILAPGCTTEPIDPAFASVDAEIHSLGMRLSFDQVDGGYTVYAGNANDATIKKAVGHLKKLRQGKTIAMVDDDRRFSFFLSNTEITDKAIKDILTLEVTQVRIDGTKVTKDCLQLLREEQHLRDVFVGKDQFSKEVLRGFIDSRPNTTITYVE
ncbi:MAG: hypothetical protein U0941_12515 [Planctomycetaceae bacterium]